MVKLSFLPLGCLFLLATDIASGIDAAPEPNVRRATNFMANRENELKQDDKTTLPIRTANLGSMSSDTKDNLLIMLLQNRNGAKGIMSRMKRQNRDSNAKQNLRACASGALIFAATNGVATAAVPNPFTGGAAAASGAISAVCQVIADNIQ